MKYLFYITNHGFGHASRNVPIIKELIKTDHYGQILIKSDEERCIFLKQNLNDVIGKVEFFSDCKENGLVLIQGSMEVDIEETRRCIYEDFNHWPYYIKRETEFIRYQKPNVVISDTMSWPLKAAHSLRVPSILIGNFTWATMYKSFFEKDIYEPYLKYYKIANKTIWYEIHSSELDNCYPNSMNVSLISRDSNPGIVEKIRQEHVNPIIFVSLGASAELHEKIDVESLPYDFITTRGINLTGRNVFRTDYNMINTVDYIEASKYVIAKGGWSTMAEILLRRKKCALLIRGNNSEDEATKEYIEGKQHGIVIDSKQLYNLTEVLKQIDKLKPAPYEYYDCRVLIAKTIIDLAQE